MSALEELVVADAAIDVEFNRRREALIAQLKNEAMHAFNRWLEAHRADYPGEKPIDLAELMIVITREGRDWLVAVGRDGLDELGGNDVDGSPVDALIRFIAWAQTDLPGGAS